MKNRRNIVLTSNRNYQVKDAVIVHSEEELKEELKKYDTDEIFVIGGESIYRMLEPLCDEAFITKIDHSYQADAHFPNLDADPSWVLKEESEENTCFDLEYVFTRYERE